MATDAERKRWMKNEAPLGLWLEIGPFPTNTTVDFDLAGARRDWRGDVDAAMAENALPRIPVAVGRDESDSCQKSTPGCCVDHTVDTRPESKCETW